MSHIAIQLEQVQQRIEVAATRVGRSAAEITLLAVSKTHPLEVIVEAYQAGARHFGENRIEEGCPKIEEMAAWSTSTDVEPPTWHFIGHVQSRKVGDLLASSFGLLHSLDSLKLAERINRLAQRDNHPPLKVLLQCNISGEAAKYGFELSQWSADEKQLAQFVAEVNHINALEKVDIQGLMTMAPYSTDPATSRPIFQNLVTLQQFLQTEIPQVTWRHLSMGMTDDFEVAIEEGATIVRVGRAIFGERIY